MNISRINSKEEFPSSVRISISRIDYLGKHQTNPLGKKEVDYYYLVLGKSKVLANQKKIITNYWVINFRGAKNIYLGKS